MKKIPYATQWIDSGDVAAVGRALRSGYLTQGPRVDEFEKAVAAYCGVGYAVAVNSGTSALHIACLAAGLKAGDEAVTSPITFVASANCTLYCGARPVFSDICDDTVCMDPQSLARKMSSRTKVVIPVHFGGHPCDMKEIAAVARKKGAAVIEDACHALGAELRGSRIGSCAHSDMSVLSFHAVKHIATGEGGMVLTNDKVLYRKLSMLRTHGITRDPHLLTENPGEWYYQMQMLGFNYRLTDIQCALGLSQLRRIDAFIKRRRLIALAYDKAFGEMDGVEIFRERPYARSSRHLYVLKCVPQALDTERTGIFKMYRERGILANVHYMPVYYHPFYRSAGYKRGICPKAEKYYEQAITLPLYPKMSESDVVRVIKVTEDIMLKCRKRGLPRCGR